MPNCKVALKRGEVLWRKYLRHQARVFVQTRSEAVGDGDTGCFLSPMLQGV